MHMDLVSSIDHIIRTRRSVYPVMFSGEEISDEEIWQIIENARWAPTHRMTQPWRFKVFRKKALQRLSDHLGQHYKEHTPPEEQSDIKYQKIIEKPILSSCVIIICMKRDEEERLPEWEEIASVAMAVQNIWLGCTARGICGYWSTPSAIIKARSFLQLEEGERCLGMFYMGRPKQTEMTVKRDEISLKTSWFDI